MATPRKNPANPAMTKGGRPRKPEPDRTNVVARVGLELRERVEKAAYESGMPSMGAWVKAVLLSAVEMHEAQGKETVEVPWGDEPPDDPAAYTAAVAVAADTIRQREAPPPRQAPPTAGQPYKFTTRECPHIPAHRRGSRCTDCGGDFRFLQRSVGLGGLR